MAKNEEKKAADENTVQAPAPAEGNEHVTQHLDRDPNDPRNATPTPVLPSLDDKSQQGPEHGRVGNDNDHSESGQNGPNV